MRQFIYYTEVFVLLHWLETCAVLEIFNFLQQSFTISLIYFIELG